MGWLKEMMNDPVSAGASAKRFVGVFSSLTLCGLTVYTTARQLPAPDAVLTGYVLGLALGCLGLGSVEKVMAAKAGAQS